MTDHNENDFIAQRRAKLAELREQGKAFPNHFKRDALGADLHAKYDHLSNEDLIERKITVKVAGRMMMIRVMGKASFVHLQDMSGHIQLYVARDSLPENVYEKFKTWDLGDIVGATGYLFKTKTGELSIHATNIELLTKALRPLPDKFHGLTDQEQRFRQRYVDLMVNQEPRRVFQIRSKIVASLRRFLDSQGFMEVETPMMHPLVGGAAARPFTTHHNALDMPLFLRIAPELYLKRLVVGGFEKVYEINRNFRNEGVSTRHNPEFTMVEFYQAYATYEDLMDFTEVMLRHISQEVLGTTTIHYQGHEIDLAKPFTRMTMREAILHYADDINECDLDDLTKAKVIAKKYKIELNARDGLGKIHQELFDKVAEPHLFQPTFITQYPKEVSPLARVNDDNDFITDRFEFFAGGREVANGFSELNDAEDQAERFRGQMAMKEAGDAETMDYDEDFITALEYGLPPTAGEGIGIDRLVMFFTDNASIRDVILFPLLRKK